MTRINLYGRLARLDGPGDIDAFEEELEDRFGSLPAPLTDLLDQARLQRLAKAAGVRQVRAGPKGVSLALPPAALPAAQKALAIWTEKLSLGDGKIVVGIVSETDADRRDLVHSLLSALA
ncbi:TRCF domain-containing protein [Caulobacter segnis]